MTSTRLAQSPKFLALLVARLFKRGQKKLNDDDVSVHAVPDAVHPQDLSGPHPIQLPGAGVGPLFYRHYEVDFSAPTRSAREIIALVKHDPNSVCPQALATFRKTKGDPEVFRVGDEFFIEITGPWNGPVKAIAETPTSFSFATEKGHMEAGEIRFEIAETGPGAFKFSIFSWARSSDHVIDFVYDTLRAAKLAQTEMWTLFCENVVKEVQGTQTGDVLVETKEAPFVKDPIPVVATNAPWAKYQARLQALAGLKINFDLQQRDTFTVANGWNVDEYRCDLPAEKPGEPEAWSSFETAKSILLNYEFPDPKLVQGIFRPEDPLDNRIMLLNAHFLWIRFYFGVRIGNIIDERRPSAEGEFRIYGYSYSTLEGHFERGQISFEIRKNLSNGKVDFKISAFSKPDHIKNIFYRWGFKLFGRSLQLRFAHSSLQRMQRLVAARAKPSI
ncbi:MAG: DUF1990 family protein [Bdellovibrionota bacterium]